MSNVKSLKRAASGTPFVVRRFDLTRLEGLSRAALDLHLDLYAGYVKQLNALQEQLQELPAKSPLEPADRLRRDGLTRRLAFEYNGMILHELFFEQLDGGARERRPRLREDLQVVLDAQYGGFDGWCEDLGQLAETRGVGWVVCGRHSSTGRVGNFWIDEHHLGLPAGMRPLLVLDLWEHAWLPDFSPADRRRYFQVLIDNTDWSVVEARIEG